MPKILINEVEQTSAGTPGRYGNYTVLLTGYIARTPVLTKDATATNPADKVQPDENGVYEFSSKQDFLNTIGEFSTSDDEISKKDSNGNITEYHYGYRMARELLGLGYQIIYRVINKVSDMNDEYFWAIFKDKASYDFRFVSHGMLETCYDQATHTQYYNRLAAIEDALSKLAELEKGLNGGKTISYTEFNNLAPDEKGRYEAAFTAAGYSFSDNAGIGDLTDTGVPYSSYITAKQGLAEDKIQIQNAIAAHNAAEFTRDVFNNINGHIAALAGYKTGTPSVDGRGDCIALIELDEDCYCEVDPTKRPEILIAEGIDELASKVTTVGEYCALTVPSVYYVGANKTTMKMPGAFHYLACFINSLGSGFAEWYAAAGYTRGVSALVIDHTSVKLGEIAINVLEPRNLDDNPQTTQAKFACNVIANFRGSYYLWGNRTAAEIKAAEGGNDLTAKHFLNIRQLSTTIKKQLYVSCRRFTFDPNSDTLWFNFVNSITPTLDAMKADQGIRDYEVVKVAANKKATLKAVIRIIPIEAVEDFDITVSLEDSFGGVSVAVEG